MSTGFYRKRRLASSRRRSRTMPQLVRAAWTSASERSAPRMPGAEASEPCAPGQQEWRSALHALPDCMILASPPDAVRLEVPGASRSADTETRDHGGIGQPQGDRQESRIGQSGPASLSNLDLACCWHRPSPTSFNHNRGRPGPHAALRNPRNCDLRTDLRRNLAKIGIHPCSKSNNEGASKWKPAQQ